MQNKKMLRKNIVLTTKQNTFLEYLEDLGYIRDKDILVKPTDISVLVKHNTSSVFKRYVPTFYVIPELTAYDVDSNHQLDFLSKAKVQAEMDGYELNVVTEADFPFDEYIS